MKRSVVCILTAFLLAICFVLPAYALPMPTGEVDGSVKKLANGVVFTKMSLEGSPYGKQKLNVIEADLTNRKLDLAILKNDYIASKSTVSKFVETYNTQNESGGKEIIAAVNGDLWMTEIHSNKNVTKSVLTVPRGMLMSDGVIYCSSQIPNEATYSTNNEAPFTFWAFGMTADRVPMIGQPVVSLTVKNNTQSLSTTTQAYNRLPAHDSLIVYDGNCNYTNYALDDAYEVVLTDISGRFTCGGTVSGTVSAIYTSNDGTSPNLDKNSIVLTARGDKVQSIQPYQIGDKVSIDVSISDVSGRDNDWSKAVLSIGGHIPLVLDGVSTNPVSPYGYPCTIIGYKNDGTLIIIQNDGRQNTWSEGLKFTYADELMLQLGVNTCINLDGGGSSTMVVGDELVNKPSDGSIRSVINGIALVSCEEERAPQGEFTPKLPYRFNARYLSFDTNDAVSQLAAGYANTTGVTAVEGAARLTAITDTIDPYLYYNVAAAFNTLSASQYKHIVIKYKTSLNVTTPRMELFLCAGAVTGPTGGKSVVFDHGTAGEWNTKIVDLTSIDYWTGTIHGIRLDYFAGNAAQGEYMDIAYIAFAKTAEDAKAYANGTAVIPTVPTEKTDITATNSRFTVENGIVRGVPSDSVAYDVLLGLSGTRMEVFDAEGNTVRNQIVCTGYTVSSYDVALKVNNTLTIAIAGDLNSDGYADNTDAAMVLKYDAGLADLADLQQAAGDIDGDSAVDNTDAAVILKIDAGLIDP